MSEIAPMGKPPRMTKAQIRKLQEKYKLAGSLYQDNTANEEKEKQNDLKNFDKLLDDIL